VKKCQKIIRGGQLIDGSGKPAYSADLGINENTITNGVHMSAFAVKIVHGSGFQQKAAG